MMFSFDRRKRELRAELTGVLRRIADVTSPNVPPLFGESRSISRANRSLPVLLTPWEDGRPRLDETAIAITKDFSDLGVAVLLHQPFRGEQVVLGFWIANHHVPVADSSPTFLRGHVRQSVEIGGGYWQLGIELQATLDNEGQDQLRPLIAQAARLVPRHELEKLRN